MKKLEKRVTGGTSYPENQNLGGIVPTHTKSVF